MKQTLDIKFKSLRQLLDNSCLQFQEVTMNISTTKQNVFIKLEQNLSQLYLFNPAKQGNVPFEEI